MADTYSAILRLRLQETGQNNNVWGSYLNTAAIQLIEDSIAGMASVTVAGTNVTLSTNNGATDQSRMAILELNGTPSAARDITVPQKTKIYVVINNTDATMTIKTAAVASASVDVDTGVTTIVVCDGTDVIELAPQSVASALNSAALGGVAAANWARLNASQNFSKAQRKVAVGMTAGATITPDFDLGNIHTVQLDQNSAIDQPTNLSGTGSQQFDMVIQQATAGGPYTATFDAFYRFVNGTPAMPVGAEDLLFIRGVYLPDLGEAVCIWEKETGSTVEDISLEVNESNVDIFRRAGSPAGIVELTVTIQEGVVITSLSPDEPAINLAGFLSGSTINIVNYGHVIGRGGRGADGGFAHDLGDTGFCSGTCEDGEDGGDAINGAGAGVTVNITNGSGYIWGGGGGGGAGGVSVDDPGLAASGGGGGGAGMGLGGRGARGTLRGDTDRVVAANGSNGRLYLDGTAAGGAAGANDLGTGGYGSASGAGGDYGTAGTDGTANTTGALKILRTLGGAAGKAVEPNSSTINFVSGGTSPNVKGAIV